MKQLLNFAAAAWLAMTFIPAEIASAQEAAVPIYNPLQTVQSQDVVKPFSYFLRQSDELGFKDAPKGVQLTIDGGYNTQFGVFSLYADTPLQPLNSRLRTLAQGRLPIISYAMLRDEIEYRVQAFASPVQLDPLNNLIVFIRVTAHNGGKEVRRAAIGGRFFDREGEFVQNLFDRRHIQ